MFTLVMDRIKEVFDVGLWAQWLAELDRTFVFLLLLPFVVAVVGLWAAYRDRDVGEVDGLLQESRGHAAPDRHAWRDPLRE
jgi:hypothetical protein